MRASASICSLDRHFAASREHVLRDRCPDAGTESLRCVWRIQRPSCATDVSVAAPSRRTCDARPTGCATAGESARCIRSTSAGESTKSPCDSSSTITPRGRAYSPSSRSPRAMYASTASRDIPWTYAFPNTRTYGAPSALADVDEPARLRHRRAELRRVLLVQVHRCAETGHGEPARGELALRLRESVRLELRPLREVHRLLRCRAARSPRSRSPPRSPASASTSTSASRASRSRAAVVPRRRPSPRTHPDCPPSPRACSPSPRSPPSRQRRARNARRSISS